jgi:acetyl esterase/lipase
LLGRLSPFVFAVWIVAVDIAGERGRATGQEPAAELLWPAGAPGALGDKPGDKPQLFPYPAAADKNVGAAVVVCPGGGYQGLAISYEGHDIAKWFNEFGVSAFVLDYRHRGKGYGHPAPLQDAQRAIRTIRARADEWKIDPQRIGILGFSAGGHLASSATVHFEPGKPDSADPVERASSRPDFAVLCYPVIAFDEPFTHRGSQQNLLGQNADADLVRKMSSEKQVTSDTPPTFLWHTTEDAGVPPENSVAFYLALRKAGVPAELHIYEKGRHGLGLATDIPSVASWPKSCEDWLRGRGLLEKPAK